MITQIRVEVLDVKRQEFELLAVLNFGKDGHYARRLPKLEPPYLNLGREDNVSRENGVRYAHELAAYYLDNNTMTMGDWCYRYGKLRDGVDVNTDGVVHYASKTGVISVDGVTQIRHIADGGFSGQFQWLKGGLGTRVPASVSITDPEKEAEMARRLETEKLERETARAARQAEHPVPTGTRFIEFGYGSMDAEISRDGERLAALLTVDDLGKDEPAGLMTRFIEVGGDDSHSGYSWGCVKNVAAVLLKHGWKTIDEIPADSPLFERVRG